MGRIVLFVTSVAAAITAIVLISDSTEQGFALQVFLPLTLILGAGGCVFSCGICYSEKSNAESVVSASNPQPRSATPKSLRAARLSNTGNHGATFVATSHSPSSSDAYSQNPAAAPCSPVLKPINSIREPSNFQLKDVKKVTTRIKKYKTAGTTTVLSGLGNVYVSEENSSPSVGMPYIPALLLNNSQPISSNLNYLDLAHQNISSPTVLFTPKSSLRQHVSLDNASIHQEDTIDDPISTNRISVLS